MLLQMNQRNLEMIFWLKCVRSGNLKQEVLKKAGLLLQDLVLCLAQKEELLARCYLYLKWD